MNFKFGTNNSMNFDWVLSSGVLVPGGGVSEFVSTWNTEETGDSNNDQISLPLVIGGDYDFTVDWGDETSNTITAWDDAAKTHTYASAGEYTIKIRGTVEGWSFNNSGDPQKLTNISKWGPMHLGTGGYYFYGCSNLTVNALDIPNTFNTTTMTSAFRACSSLNMDMSSWDMSKVSNFNNMFRDCSTFNGSVDGWDTANATSFFSLFFNCAAFDRPLGSWNTANVISFNSLFSGCGEFNQDLGEWETGNVTSFERVFYNCAKFDQYIGDWDTAKVESMLRMFYICRVFNQDIGGWDTGNTRTFNNMFANCDAFNQVLEDWDTSKVTNMASMFSGCDVFDQDLGTWDITSLTDAASMLSLVSLSTANYDSLLTGWEAQAYNNDVPFHGGNSQYSPGAPATARANLVADGWIITDGDQVP